jgi:hypothetical protein
MLVPGVLGQRSLDPEHARALVIDLERCVLDVELLLKHLL